MKIVSLNDFSREVQCTYRDEVYSVRDNGTVMRHPGSDNRRRPSDNIWTFGKLNSKSGYREIASVSIHRIVATAFHGDPPAKDLIADHIDTNKQNNRPENLRWVTRLENIILNPITAKRIAQVCGSVEAFLADPPKFKDKFQESNMKWMKPVTLEEAQRCKDRLLSWAFSNKPSSGMTLDDWIFMNNRGGSPNMQETVVLVKSLTPNAVQKDWRTPAEFPFCPDVITDTPIYSYYSKLKVGEVFSRDQYSNKIIVDFALSNDKQTLWIMCNSSDPNSVKPWLLAQISFEDNFYVHANLGSYFRKDGATKYFTLAQGLEWTGGETFDDLT